VPTRWLCLFVAILGRVNAQNVQPLTIEHVTLIDATGAPPVRDISIAIENGRITRIAKRIPPGPARVINARGKFVIPGLWDMHVHIGATPEKFFPLFAAAGVSGVREMYSGVPAAVIAQWRANPDSPWIVAPGFIDGPLMLTPPPGATAVSTPEQARLAVRYLAQSGANFLKVYNSIPREAYFALAEEAAVIGIPFAGHVPEAVSPREAAEAGQRSQEHLLNVLLACSPREEELRAERIAIMTSPAISAFERARLLGFPQPEGLFDTYDVEKAEALFRTFVERGTWHTPTLVLLKGFAFGDALLRDPHAAFMPAAWRMTPHPRDKFYMQDLAPAEFDALAERVSTLLQRYKTLVGDMHRSGVQFLAGTDVSMTNPVLIGFGLHEELALLVEAGLTPMEALQTATRNPAQYLGRLADMGTVEAGKIADLVLLDADPLKDIHNTQKIHGVVWHGRYLDRKDLDARLTAGSR